MPRAAAVRCIARRAIASRKSKKVRASHGYLHISAISISVSIMKLFSLFDTHEEFDLTITFVPGCIFLETQHFTVKEDFQ